MKKLILTALLVCTTFTLAFAGGKGEEGVVQRVKALGGKVEMGEGKLAGNVVKVDLSGTSVQNLDLRDLIQLKELRSLDLSGTSITDGTQYISFIKNLESLDISGTKVDDAALTKLRSLKKLASLNIANTSVTDQGLQAVGKFSSLKDLSIANSKVTESGKTAFRIANPNINLSDAE